jgi:hypothetical protein
MTFMKKLFLSLLLAFLYGAGALAQDNTLFDDTRLSAVHITIPPDSLAAIYDSVLSDHYYLARFVFDDNEGRDTLDNIGFRLRGNTSRYSKKKSFKISFNEYVSGRKYQGVKKINLNGEHNDPTMIREKLYYDIWKRSGMVERRTNFVRMYINGTYYGLYTNLEEMEKEWITRVYPKNGGNLYKCTYPADLVYHGPLQQTYKDLENETATGGRVYDLQTNKSQDDYTRLVELITALNQPVDETFAAEISTLVDVDHFLKSLALDVATGNWDDYSYNKNNYYLYENPLDSTFDFITYDPDNTFGVDWVGVDWGTRDCRNWINRSKPLPLAQKLMAIPAFYAAYKSYLDTIVNTWTSPDSVFSRIDGMKQMIQQAAEEDLFRTLDYGYTVADFNNAFIQAIDDHSPYGLKPFFTIRRNSILSQLHASGGSEADALRKAINVFPNPATETLTISLTDKPDQPFEAIITDSYGSMQLHVWLQENPDGIHVGSLTPGMYLLQVNTPGHIHRVKFIKN